MNNFITFIRVKTRKNWVIYGLPNLPYFSQNVK